MPAQNLTNYAGVNKADEKSNEIVEIILWGLVVPILFIIVLILIVLAIKSKRTSRKSSAAEYSSSIKQTPTKTITTPSGSNELMDKARKIVRDARIKGYADFEIRQKFKESGWNEASINELMTSSY